MGLRIRRDFLSPFSAVEKLRREKAGAQQRLEITLQQNLGLFLNRVRRAGQFADCTGANAEDTDISQFISLFMAGPSAQRVGLFWGHR